MRDGKGLQLGVKFGRLCAQVRTSLRLSDFGPAEKRGLESGRAIGTLKPETRTYSFDEGGQRFIRGASLKQQCLRAMPADKIQNEAVVVNPAAQRFVGRFQCHGVAAAPQGIDHLKGIAEQEQPVRLGEQ